MLSIISINVFFRYKGIRVEKNEEPARSTRVGLSAGVPCGNPGAAGDARRAGRAPCGVAGAPRGSWHAARGPHRIAT